MIMMQFKKINKSMTDLEKQLPKELCLGYNW